MQSAVLARGSAWGVLLGCNISRPHVQVCCGDKNECRYNDHELDAQVKEVVRVMRTAFQERCIRDLVFNTCGGTPEGCGRKMEVNQKDYRHEQNTSVNEDKGDLRDLREKKFCDSENRAIEEQRPVHDTPPLFLRPSRVRVGDLIERSKPRHSLWISILLLRRGHVAEPLRCCLTCNRQHAGNAKSIYPHIQLSKCRYRHMRWYIYIYMDFLACLAVLAVRIDC